MTVRRCLAVVICTLATGCAPSAGERVSGRLAGAARAEVFAIDPDRQTADEGTFRDHRILASAPIADAATTRELADAIRGAVYDPPAGMAKGCLFRPQHGVRFVAADGAATDFVICFACGDARMFGAGGDDSFWISKDARGEIDAVFARHGVPAPAAD